MENVVRLADYRRRRQKARRAAAAADSEPQYFCLRCDAYEFRIYASGKVHCAHCGALIANLALAETAKP